MYIAGCISASRKCKFRLTNPQAGPQSFINNSASRECCFQVASPPRGNVDFVSHIRLRVCKNLSAFPQAGVVTQIVLKVRTRGCTLPVAFPPRGSVGPVAHYRQQERTVLHTIPPRGRVGFKLHPRLTEMLLLLRIFPLSGITFPFSDFKNYRRPNVKHLFHFSYGLGLSQQGYVIPVLLFMVLSQPFTDFVVPNLGLFVT